MADEHQTYTGGQKLLIEEWRGWKICPLICYDLRFPVWSRNRMVNGAHLYDALIYVANWPAVRKAPWMKLLLARAIENQVYTVGVNRVGIDGNGMEYSGNSSFIDPRGEYLQAFEEGKEEVRVQTFSFSELEDFRKKFPAIDDADDFEIR
jgi:predicted amidohydrolase